MRALEPMDFQMVGAGRKSKYRHSAGAARAEILYVQGGTRRSAGARAARMASRLRKALKVVVTRFEHGIAYVRLWDEFTKDALETNGLRRNFRHE